MRVTPMRISARQSDLARLQAYRVGEALRNNHPQIEVVYHFRSSLGDLNQTDPLWKMPEKGVFTEDFLRDLTEGSAEMVVHSWKDLPTEPRTRTAIVATLPRADVRDLLLFRRDRLATAAAAGRVRVLTSSPRRAHNLEGFLRAYLPFPVSQVDFESVRGNIPTRLKKLLQQDVEALVVAKAALDRLLAATEPEFKETQDIIRQVLRETEFMVLPLSINPTAAAQGALAVEISLERPDLREVLNAIHDSETFACVEKERQILAGYGGGCHQKIGVTVLRRPFGEITFLRGLTDRGEVLDQIRLETGLAPQPRAQNHQELFASGDKQNALFSRVPRAPSEWQAAQNERYLWVARESAWPAEFRAHAQAKIWTAGLGSWRKLAARGVWVHGCAESLGEEEPTRIETLAGEIVISWLRLTHAQNAGEGRVCATYDLNATADIPHLHDKTHFFWSSGTAFDRAVELMPDIVSRGYHACGPGKTYQHLQAKLSGRLAVHLSAEAWRKAVGPA